MRYTFTPYLQNLLRRDHEAVMACQCHVFTSGAASHRRSRGVRDRKYSGMPQWKVSRAQRERWASQRRRMRKWRSRTCGHKNVGETGKEDKDKVSLTSYSMKGRDTIHACLFRGAGSTVAGRQAQNAWHPPLSALRPLRIASCSRYGSAHSQWNQGWSDRGEGTSLVDGPQSVRHVM
jgi:hypothetical protein